MPHRYAHSYLDCFYRLSGLMALGVMSSICNVFRGGLQIRDAHELDLIDFCLILYGASLVSVLAVAVFLLVAHRLVVPPSLGFTISLS